jgi:hypothetical protein
MFKDNADLYPTPENLIRKMVSKVKWNSVKNILEPSAGLGHIVDYINKDMNKYSKYNISTIELDNNCRNVLLQKNINVIDSDFLAYNGLEQFDLIIANFPFSDGDKHLHKALDVLFSGQIVCLLNAETIKNPFSNSRKDLVSKLNKLNASIEYIENAFLDADRKTGVEVALIYIEKIRDVETEIFNDMTQSDENIEDLKDKNEIATKDDILNLIARYNQEKEFVTNQIMDFYRNYKKVSKYLTLAIVGEDVPRYATGVKPDTKELTELMKSKLNYFSTNLKRSYWLEAMNLKEVKTKLTSQKRKELSSELNKYCNMDFTFNNVRIFIDNLIAKYPLMIDEAIEYIFDKMTHYAFRDGRNANNEYSKNIHMYNGWKTNDAYKVNKKVILPFSVGSYLSSDKEDFFDDVDMVFSYFDTNNLKNDSYLIPDKYSPYGTKSAETTSTAQILKYEIAQGITQNIKTRFFNVTFYKKGTVHITFLDLDILRKFNIFIAKKRNWLPSDYGYTEKRNKDVDFETDKDYKQIGTELAINTKNVLMLN